MHPSDEQFESICASVIEAKTRRPRPWIAVFDADGTLWDTDLGEAFFDYEIRHAGLSLPPDPWDHYLTTKAVDAPKAYLWLAQINAGRELSEIRAWAETAFAELSPFPLFEFQKKLIEFLHTEEFEVYIVTASVKWAVEPGAKRLGIPAARVLGVKTKVVGNTLTDQQDGAITYRKGKAEALLLATNNIKPILAAGNTLGDLQLLEAATDVAIAVVSQNPGEPLFATEHELQREAEKRGWLQVDLSHEY